MGRRGDYDRAPFVPVGPDSSCDVGWPAILERLRPLRSRKRCVLAVECYPGVDIEKVRRALGDGLLPVHLVELRQAYKDPAEIEKMCAPYLGDDPLFGRMNRLALSDFFEPGRSAVLRGRADAVREGLVLIVGAGASLLCPPDVVVYADLARGQIRERQKRGEVASLGVHDQKSDPGRLLKRSFFIDWRAADRLKRSLLDRVDWLLDTNDGAQPKLIAGDELRRGLAATARGPFRVVPCFDTGLEGGRWLGDTCRLPGDAPGGRCFDCAPEETSLLLGFGGTRVEVPALDLVFRHARALLGEAVHARFGVEFPIRFDLLDTMGGGNLPLQVAPSTEYIQDRFGMHVTQDASYYLLAAAEGARVYLGLREGIDRDAMIQDLRSAQQAGGRFPDERYVGSWPAKKHDHFLIPAGTVHGTGKDCVVLEIGAAPFAFGFELWGWQRPGPAGRPRPVSIDHGAANIQWEHTTAWAERQAVSPVSPVSAGAGWREERTGLHEREFIETRRHWFTGTVPHETRGGVNVLNLVEGQEALVESPSSSFEPFLVHYAETFVVPASVGAYTVRPHGPAAGSECATIKAFVRARA